MPSLGRRPKADDHMGHQAAELYLYDQFLAIELSGLPTKQPWP